MIAAGAGVGKTSAVKHYAETRPNVWVLTAEPSLSSHSKMMEYMREELGIPETSRHQVSRAVAAKLANTQGLIIIDEAQHLTPKCIDQLRSVFDRSGIGLALVGNQEVWARIDGGGRKDALAQLFSRVGMRVTVARPSAQDIEIMLDAREVTDAKQRQILRIVANRPGALRAMEKTLRAARMIAMGAGQALDVSHLEAAWNRLSGGEGVAS